MRISITKEKILQLKAENYNEELDLQLLNRRLKELGIPSKPSNKLCTLRIDAEPTEEIKNRLRDEMWEEIKRQIISDIEMM